MQLATFSLHGGYTEGEIRYGATQTKNLIEELYQPTSIFNSILYSEGTIAETLGNPSYYSPLQQKNSTESPLVSLYRAFFDRDKVRQKELEAQRIIDFYQLKRISRPERSNYSGWTEFYELYERNPYSLYNVVTNILTPNHKVPNKVIINYVSPISTRDTSSWIHSLYDGSIPWDREGKIGGIDELMLHQYKSNDDYSSSWGLRP